MLDLNDYRAIATLASRLDIPFDIKRINESGYIYVTSSRVVVGGEAITMGHDTLECVAIGHYCSGNPRLPVAIFRNLTTRQDVVIGEMKQVLSDYFSNYIQKRMKITEGTTIKYESPRIIITNSENGKVLRLNLENGKFSHLVHSENAYITIPHKSKDVVSHNKITVLKELLVLANMWEYNPAFGE